MSGFNLEKVPVEFATERLQGDLGIQQDEHGRLGLRIIFDKRNYEGGAPIKAVPGFSPAVTIEPAYYNGHYNEGGRDAFIKVHASTVIIDYESDSDKSELVSVKYVLAGQRQDGFGGDLILDDRLWRLDVERERVGTFIHKTPPWDEYGRGSSGCQSRESARTRGMRRELLA